MKFVLAAIQRQIDNAAEIVAQLSLELRADAKRYPVDVDTLHNNLAKVSEWNGIVQGLQIAKVEIESYLGAEEAQPTAPFHDIPGFEGTVEDLARVSLFNTDGSARTNDEVQVDAAQKRQILDDNDDKLTDEMRGRILYKSANPDSRDWADLSQREKQWFIDRALEQRAQEAARG